MFRFSARIFLAAALLALPVAGSAAALEAGARTAPAYAGYARSRLLLQPRSGLAVADAERPVKGMGGRLRRLAKRLDVQVVELPAAMDEVAALKRLRASGKYAYVELDMAVAPAASVTDPGFASSWGVQKIGAPAAWDVVNGSGVTVAVLDTGVFSAHPDLAANMVAGWNTFDNSADSADVHGHGTSVAGVVAMQANNGVGGAGIAHGAKIMPIRITDTNGYAYFSTMAAGVTWAADHGARVANISFSGVAGSYTVDVAAQYMRDRGGVVVVAAGNTGGELAYTSYENLLVVGATDSNDARASFSSYGAFVDLAAPGVSIYTTNRSGSYGQASGTSFASPVAAATVALMLAANPDLDAAEVRSILYQTARDLGAAGKDTYFGHGRVDAAAAVLAAYAQRPLDSVAPVVSLLTALAGVNLAGVVNFDVAASDNRGVARVDVYLDGQLVASDSNAPYAFSLDTRAFANGLYAFSVQAVDAAGNVGYAVPVIVAILNPLAADAAPPSFTSFTPGVRLVLRGGKLRLAASATDDRGVARIALSVDGRELAVVNGASVNFVLPVESLKTGPHVLAAHAWDAAGNVASVASNFFKLPKFAGTTRY